MDLEWISLWDVIAQWTESIFEIFQTDRNLMNFDYVYDGNNKMKDLQKAFFSGEIISNKEKKLSIITDNNFPLYSNTGFLQKNIPSTDDSDVFKNIKEIEEVFFSIDHEKFKNYVTFFGDRFQESPQIFDNKYQRSSEIYHPEIFGTSPNYKVEGKDEKTECLKTVGNPVVYEREIFSTILDNFRQELIHTQDTNEKKGVDSLPRIQTSSEFNLDIIMQKITQRLLEERNRSRKGV